MNKEKRWVTLNSAMLYVTAFLLTTCLHELFHALAGVLLGSKPVLHHNYVEHFAEEGLSPASGAKIALAGPVFSLFQGIVVALLFFWRKKQDLLKLFLLWFAILGLNNFFGYLMTGPVFTNGDIGKVYELLGIPLLPRIVVAAAGIAFLVVMANKLSLPFLRFSFHGEWVAEAPARKAFAFGIIILPWLIGSGTMTLMYLPVAAIVSIIYPVMSGMIFIFSWQNARRVQQVPLSTYEGVGNPSIPLMVVLAVLMLFFRLVLAPGITL